MMLQRACYILSSALFLASGTAGAQDHNLATVSPREEAPSKADREQAATGPQQPPPPQQAPGQPTQVEPRGNYKDQQNEAPRVGTQTLDPTYAGFIPVPNTPLLIKFNAKPRTDVTIDNRNSGDDNRFVTALIPITNSPQYGGGTQFNINSKATQLSVDVRAPSVDGAPRFYYENDFFGSGPGEFPYRITQLYGEIYNLIVGMTYSVFEDPDVWPDTVDFEGPNAMVFARRPLVRYMLPLDEHWQMNFGIEQPGSEVDISNDPGASNVNHAPDIGFNVRWEEEKIGHIQFAMIFRDLGVIGGITGPQETFGWGVNLSGNFDLPWKDTLQTQWTYGQGLFRYINDNFENNDGAFNSRGELKPIPYFGAMIGYTHYWSEEWRSTATYGFVHLTNLASQAGTQYHETNYVSFNVVRQFRPRLSVGLEGLYGSKVDKADRTGDVFRVQIGLLFKLQE
jgi:hypothetical protein